MKTLTLFCSMLLAPLVAQAQALRFTAGTVSNYNDVTLSLAGPSNQVCKVERFSRLYQVWQSMGTFQLSTNGSGSFSTTLDEGIYGFYRAQSTNGVYLSTNAFGAVAGYIPINWSMFGNPFGVAYLSTIIPEPEEGTWVYRYTTNGYQTCAYQFGTWSTNPPIQSLEGLIVLAPTNAVQRFLVSGIFDTNAIVKPIPTGWSIICSQRYQLLSPTNWLADLFTTNLFGGYSQVPVQSPGFSLECTVSKLTGAGTYDYYQLTNNVWRLNGTPTPVPIEFVEGFWINKPTNATWSAKRTIW